MDDNADAAPSGAQNEDQSLLDLFLGIHSYHQAPAGALDYLTIRDLVQLRCLNRRIRQQLAKGIDYIRSRDGRNYIVPYPGYPGLLESKNDCENSGLFPHQLASLAMMRKLENPYNARFGDLRGGILADAPGLGKTITVLALITSTAGMRPLVPGISVNAQSIQNGWNSLRTNPAYQQDLNVALRPIRTWARNDHVAEQAVQNLLRNIAIPFADNRFKKPEAFVRHVKTTLRGIVPTAELELFQRNFDRFVLRLDKGQRSFYASSEGRRLLLERSLVPSGATLIVVPDALLEHWFEQPLHHLALQRFVEYEMTDNSVPRGVIYLDGIGDIADASIPLGRVDLNREMPNAFELMRYLIVVTTFSRCEGEYRRERRAGRLKELDKKDANDSAKTKNGKNRKRSRRRREAVETRSSSEPVSTLLKIRWLRLVVDEGHELGAHNASGLGLTHVLHEIAAERRWVLSGTPTTGDEDAEGYTASCLDQLQRLLCFLRHPVYGAVQASGPELLTVDEEDLEKKQNTAHRNWETNVKIPFLQGEAYGRENLLRLLKGVMVMHRKDHINLPRPIFLQGEVTVPVKKEVQQEVVEVGSPHDARYLLNKYLESEEYQSLVDEAQAAYIVESIRKARENREKQLQERGQDLENLQAIAEYNPDEAHVDLRPIKAVVYSSSNNILLSVAQQLYDRLVDENIAEMHGKVGDLSTELSRFRNGYKRILTCPICGGVNDIGDGRAHCKRTLIEVVETDGLERRLLIEPERVIRAVRPGEGGNVDASRLGDLSHSQYWRAKSKWRVDDLLEVDIRDPHPLALTERKSNETWEEWGSQKCFQLAAADHFAGCDWFFGPLADPDREMGIVRVRLKKFQSCGRFHNPRRWYKGPKFADVPVEVIEEDVFILCLYSEVSHGLDLSFVTNMYLLEPIDDAALLQQVTSRAHRLGATGPITVETVNVWQDIDDETKEATRGSYPAGASNKNSTALRMETEHQTEKAICEFCCRSFKSTAEAEKHERTNCPNNPDCPVKEDNFHLSSVYREIRPPQALSTC